MSTIITITGVIKSVHETFAFAETAVGDVFIPNKVMALCSADLTFGATVEMRVDTEAWSEKREEYGNAATDILDIQPAQAHTAWARVKYFDVKRNVVKLVVVGGDVDRRTLDVSKDVWGDAKASKRMPVEATVLIAGKKAQVVSIITGRVVQEQVKAVEAAITLDDTQQAGADEPVAATLVADDGPFVDEVAGASLPPASTPANDAGGEIAA